VTLFHILTDANYNVSLYNVGSNGGFTLLETLNISTNIVRGAYIAYDGPSGSKELDTFIDATLYFNVSDAGQYCTLLHHDDDVPRQGFSFARDNGRGSMHVWGNLETSTFMIRREDAFLRDILGVSASYAIVCF